MKFGQVEDPSKIDFKLPQDSPDTLRVLTAHKDGQPFQVYVGCAKWNRQDLKGFYPRGTKDELEYYATQFNSIELNATFYNMPDKEQVKTWKNKTPEGFKFFPKITNTISHFRRLNNVSEPVEKFADAVSNFEDRLGSSFLQMHDNFKPNQFEKVEKFILDYPKAVPLAVEVRNTEWVSDKKVAEEYYKLLEENSISNIIVDTAGRRDLLHMRLTTPAAFIRYVGANHESDYTRLDDWIVRIKKWRDAGLNTLYFFVHQNIEKESPKLSAHFIEKLNKEFNLSIKIPGKEE